MGVDDCARNRGFDVLSDVDAAGDANSLTAKMLGVLVDQNRVSWNRLEAWLRRLDRLRRLEPAA